ncbi:Uncharacterized protein YR821_1723 [Yersinia ruckeri]|uniref:Uncharacterized protein n=1 Tax=Yersinia ruckeri TaxID=29486 RepID=A0A0A8VCP5_YERRU|nr:Uncharacterized protein YR821_1723 [Yersinia ruckeri]CEK27542.1 hypothetical protein CSF007_8945 [Yersinia ruckeri]
MVPFFLSLSAVALFRLFVWFHFNVFTKFSLAIGLPARNNGGINISG